MENQKNMEKSEDESIGVEEQDKKRKVKENYIVIGNGFDLSMGMKSSYNHFLNAIIKQYNLKTNEDIYGFNNLFVREFHGRELNWSDFETIFETQMIEINESLEYSKHDQLKNYRVNKLNGDLKELEKLFYHYIKKEYDEWKFKRNRKKLLINPFYLKLFSDPKTHIMTFNFTKVLDDLFEDNEIKNSKIYQLHGSLEKNNIIFGGGFTGSNDISKVSLEGSLTNDKLVRIKQDTLLFSQREQLILKVNQAENNPFNLFILGHSIMGSDFIFMQPFFEKAEKIYMFYYNQDFSDKFQFFIKQLGREYAEKIYLVPFFDVLSTNDCKVVIKGLDEYNLVKEVFNVPIPQDEETSNLFEDIEVYDFSFILQSIKQIKITSMKELQKLLDIFRELSPESICLQDNFVINVTGVNDSVLLSELFTNPIYKESLKQANKIEITNCNIYWRDFYYAFEENELEELVLKDNIVLYELDENKFDISRLTKLKDLVIEKNEFQLRNETNSEKQNLKIDNFEVVLENPLNYLYRIIALDNQGMRVDESLCNKDIKSKIVKIEIDSTVSRLCFPEVEYLELNGLEGTSLPEIEISNKVGIVKLNDFDNEKLCISTLFNSKDNQLPKLQEFEINNMPLKELYSNVLCNVFDYKPILRCNSKEMFFSKIISDQIVCIKKNNLMNLFDSSDIEMNDKNSLSKTMIQKKLSISDEEIQRFANKWYISYEDLNFFLNNYNYNLSLKYQNGFQDLKQKGDYEKYKKNGGEIKSLLHYRNQFSKDLETLIDRYSVEV
ncbi:AbiH family protein [Bacillus cereus group sp. BfR-BA-01361]|uniref:AbiH family protein n=1 Tax=Bacillus cereus group sp. BfR-BA-01361 TaxID=2920322 RepID=UPI001F5ADE17|nr:AbiH family protein [Bacillus cereus group sp. BfR-BA-01361]